MLKMLGKLTLITELFSTLGFIIFIGTVGAFLVKGSVLKKSANRSGGVGTCGQMFDGVVVLAGAHHAQNIDRHTGVYFYLFPALGWTKERLKILEE